jgi:hypothetical protein
MKGSQFDYAHRAAEAFMAANRCENPEEAQRLRLEAYRLVDQLRDDWSRRSGQGLAKEEGQSEWTDILSQGDR